METYTILFEISLILLFTKGFGLLTRKLSLPQVVGALLGGILLGPAALGWVQLSPVLELISEIGVILLMFSAGMETNIKSISKNGKSAPLPGLIDRKSICIMERKRGLQTWEQANKSEVHHHGMTTPLRQVQFGW